ncbi:MAG: helicase associated domain-containing protein [Oscillospiraceae bacterium]|jgi:hypothetical protein|nr:helicase associated domain-containing protein [Oscillospiraceae bacterium]
MYTEKSKATFEQRWDAMYDLACKYYFENRHLLIPHSYMTLCGKRLGRWISTQRHDSKIGASICTPQRKEKLDALGMIWDVKSWIWWQMYELAGNYAKDHKTLNIPIGYVSQTGEALGEWIGEWISNQRSRRKQGLIKKEQILLLDELGMEWNIIDDRWNKYYEKCISYMRQYGVDRIPSEYKEDGMSLGSWLMQQKRAFCEKRLRKDQYERIKELNRASYRQEQWETWFKFARDFWMITGHLFIPPETMCKLGNLYSWIATQRLSKRAGRLTECQISQLESIGMIWMVRNNTWEEMYKKAMAFHSEKGHLLVPRGWENDPRLAAWIANQRKERRIGHHTLTPERISRLDQIDMVWDPFSVTELSPNARRRKIFVENC